MGAPVLGTYVSENKVFSIQITSANPSNGVIGCIYKTQYSPVGELNLQGDCGNYNWVFSKKAGRDGVAPFSIGFQFGQRPEPGRPFMIRDTWNGAYREDNTLLLEGTRSYVNSDGVVQVVSLGTQVFSL